MLFLFTTSVKVSPDFANQITSIGYTWFRVFGYKVITYICDKPSTLFLAQSGLGQSQEPAVKCSGIYRHQI